jgi:molybdopterin molybdotransferase
MSGPASRSEGPRAAITGVVLAGGLGRRMQGADKGLVALAGEPMVAHVLRALCPQVGAVLLNANRNLERYAGFGHPVIADCLDGYAGPLAGVLSALRRAATEFLLAVPCDAPLLAPDLAARLHAACVSGEADLAVARDARGLQPVFMLLHRRVAPALEDYLGAGGRRVDAWFDRVRVTEVDFSDTPDAFVNVNDADERLRVEERILSTAGRCSVACSEQRTGETMTEDSGPLPAGVDPCDLPRHGQRLLRLHEACARIVADIVPVAGQETAGLHDALGRVLARDLHSDVDLPPHRNSSMDGYALAGADLPREGSASFALAGTSWAGRPHDGAVGRGQCVRIMTGATLPEATDTVVMQEQVRLEGGRVVIEAGHHTGQNVRPVGEDVRRGDRVLAAGAVLHPARLGLLAALGIAEVAVLRRPRIAIFSTGDELRSIGEPLGPGQIHDSNRCTLRGMLARLPVEVVDLGVVQDTREDTRRACESAAGQADAIVTSGGVSVGEADFVTETLERHGRFGFWKVAMKPGKPIAFGRYGGAYFFGLPGNPVSAMVTFYQLVQPALRALAGVTEVDPPILLRAACESRLRKKPGRLEFQRGVLARLPCGAYTVRSTGHQGAGVLRSMSEANCFIVLPLEQGDVEPGAEVEVQPFAGLV